MGVLLLFLWGTFSDAGAIFLYIQKSAKMVGMGYTGVARWEDPSASYLNPASGVFNQGLSATSLNTGTPGLGELIIRAILNQGEIPREPNWLNALSNDMYNRHWEVGWTKDMHHWLFRRIALRVTGTRLSLGTVDAYDENGNYLGSWEPYDQANSVNFSILLPYGVSLGYTLKYIYSFLAPRDILGLITGENISGEAKTFTNDYGLLINPGIGISLGVAMNNDGGHLKYSDIESAHASPIPKYLRYGYSLNLNDMFSFLTGFSFSSYFSLTYSEDWFTDRVGKEHETWHGEGYEVGVMNLFYFRKGTFKDYSGMRVGQTEGLGIRFGAINLDVADDGDIYGFDQPHNWWVSLTLQTPQYEGMLDKLLGKKVMGWTQAILFPGAGHIYEGNEKGLIYSTLSTFLYTSYLRNKEGVLLFGTSVVYALSLIDYYFWR